MPLTPPDNSDPFRRLVEIMRCLLSEEGCPWDRQQTHDSLKPYVIEESYEVCEAIDDRDFDELRAELGDLGLQIVFHSALAECEGHFKIDDVYRGICEKLIRRHPHVFADTDADDAETVLKNWEQIKREERQEKKSKDEKPPSALDGVPKNLPGLQRAQRIQSKAARVGFDWADIAPVFDKIREEIDELEEAVQASANEVDAPVHSSPDQDAANGIIANQTEITHELGDLLFAIVNLARFLRVDPEQAIQTTNKRFTERFHYIESKLNESNRTPSDSNLEEMDQLWNEAKRVLGKQM